VHRSSIAVRSATIWFKLVIDVFGVQRGFAVRAGQGLDERRPVRQVPARDEDPPAHRSPVPYRGDLGQFLVVSLAQHSLLERIKPLVQPEAKRGELGVKRADHGMQNPDRVASGLGVHRTCLAQGSNGGARRAAQRDQESSRVVAVHFDGLVEFFIEAEADEHDAVPVNLQLRSLAKLF
jgi:hypothetical protein